MTDEFRQGSARLRDDGQPGREHLENRDALRADDTKPDPRADPHDEATDGNREACGHDQRDRGRNEHASQRASDPAERARDRCHVDDPSAQARQHVRDHGARHQERALEVHVNDEIPRLFRHFPRQAPIGAVRRRGVVDEDVDATELVFRPVDDRLDLGRVSHVAAHAERPDPELDDELRRYYGLTDFGRRVLTAEAERIAKAMAVIQGKHVLGDA